MAIAKKSGPRNKPELIASQQFAQVFQAYLECSNEVQRSICELVEVVNDPEATRDEIEAALATISEALFPSCPDDGILWADIDKCGREASGRQGG